MTDERKLIISRIYQKESNRQQIFVARITGSTIAGSLFQYEVWHNDTEDLEKRVTSGDKYHVRRAFITKLLDLHEDGWKRVNFGTYGTPEEVAFFDPEKL